MMTIQRLMLELKEEFSIEMLDEDACRNWFLKKIHANGVHCPECGREITSARKLETFWAMRRTSCPHCGRSLSALTGTALNKITIEFRALYLLLFMIGHGGRGVHVNNIAKQLGISTGAAYFWANKAKRGDTSTKAGPVTIEEQQGDNDHDL